MDEVSLEIAFGFFFMDEKINLTKSEWLFAVTIVFLIFSFLVISKKTSYRNLEQLARTEKTNPLPMIEVKITGCVKKPGVFHVPQSSSLRSIARQARFSPAADLSRIDLDRSIQESCSIHIPSLENIVVRVEGCVAEPSAVAMPVGSRISDVKKHIILTQDADPTVFKSRRLLKNNEIIFIEPKNSE